MQVNHKVALQYKQGPEVIVPDTLLVQGDGQQWLKLRPSNFAIVKLLLGHLPDFKSTKNPTLANCSQFGALLQMQKDEILKSMSASESKGDEIFEEGEGQSKGGKKVSLDYAPPTITLDIDGVSVLFKTPSTWRESDLCVLLDTAQLTAVCDFLLKDSSLNISSEKRPYQKSGSYSKKLKV